MLSVKRFVGRVCCQRSVLPVECVVTECIVSGVLSAEYVVSVR